MQYTISNSQITVTGTPRIPGKPGATGVVFSNADGTSGITIRRKRLRVELSRKDAEQVLEIPDDVDQTDLERLMDDTLVFAGDLSADERDEKWGIGEYAPDNS